MADAAAKRRCDWLAQQRRILYSIKVCIVFMTVYDLEKIGFEIGVQICCLLVRLNC